MLLRLVSSASARLSSLITNNNTRLQAVVLRSQSRVAHFLLQRISHRPNIFITMNKLEETVESLVQQQKLLQDKVHELVNKLEAHKNAADIKVPADAIMRSKEEQEASAAIEKLKIQEEAKAASTESTQNLSSQAGDKQKGASNKQPKQKGGGSKEAAAAAAELPVDVSRLDLRVGKIIEVSRHPDADSLYVERIDCGDATGPRTVISGLVKHVPMEEMQDRLVVVLCNLKPAKMRGILSEAMVMCASTPDKVEILGVPAGAKAGDRLVCEGCPGEPDSQLNPKKKVWEQVSPDIKTDADGVAMYKGVQFRVAGVDGLFKSSLANVNIR